MEDKESYTNREVEEMYKSLRVYQLSLKAHHVAESLGFFMSKKKRLKYKEDLKNSIEEVKQKFPKSLLNKIELIDLK